MTSPEAPRFTEGPESADVVSRAREALQGVTEGPWRVVRNSHPECSGRDWGWIEGPGPHWCWSDDRRRHRTDATFAAAARSLVPELVAEVELLRAHLNAIPSALRGYVGCELDGYSYHGDGSAIEALKKVSRDAESVVAYAATSRDVRAAAAELARLRAGVS